MHADWAFPLYGELHGYLQGFYGWADSMQNYNFRNAGVGMGVWLIEWRRSVPAPSAASPASQLRDRA